LDIGNKSIVSYRIEFMPTIHSPIRHYAFIRVLKKFKIVGPSNR
jgi:hypothetical protein